MIYRESSTDHLEEALVDHVMTDNVRDGIEEALDLTDLFETSEWEYEHRLWR